MTLKKKHPVLILFLAIIFTSTLLRSTLVAIGPISEIVIADLKINATSFGLITTIPLLVFALSSVVIPFIASKRGLINTLIGGIILMMIGSLLRSIPSYNILLFGTILLGFGISIGNVLIPATIKEYAQDRKAIFTSTYLCMQNLFASIASGLAIYVAIQFSWSFLMSFWIIPAGIGLILWLQFKKRNITEDDTPKNKQPTLTWKMVKVLLTSPYAWCLSLIMGLQSILYYTNVTWLPTIVSNLNFSSEFISFLMISFQLIALPGLFLVPILVQKIKVNSYILLVSSLMVITGVVLLLFAKQGYLIYIATLLASLGAGNCFAWVVAIITNKTKDSQQASSMSAMSQTIGYFMAAIGPWLGGLLVDFTNDSHTIIIFILIVGLTISLISIYIYLKRNVLTFDK